MRTAFVSGVLAAFLLLPVSGCELVDKLEESGSSAQTVEVPGQGVSFEVPKDWDAINADMVSAAGFDDAFLRDVAGRMNMEPAHLKQLLGKVDLFIASPHAENGVLTNITVIGIADPKMPSAKVFRKQFRKLGARDIDITTLSTKVGDGFRVEYTRPVKDRTMRGIVLIFAHRGALLDITVTAASPDQAGELADQIVGSLAETD